MSGPDETPTIAPAPIGVTAIVGHSRVGPMGTLQSCRSDSDFNRHFGDIEQAPLLAPAVRGFFENGGRRCLVLNLGYPARPLAPEDLRGLDDEASIELVCAPGKELPSDHQLLLGHCAAKGTRLAILDGPEDLARSLVRFRPPSHPCGAIYAPWLSVYDPASRADISVPPSGHIAGLMNRVADERSLGKAPANEPLQGITGLSHEITQSEQDILHPRRVNCIRNLPNLAGIRPWGEQMLSPRPFASISAFRVWSFVVRSIENGSSWLAGSISDPDLWERLEGAVTAFLEEVCRSGALASEVPDEAFRVRCDAEINDESRRARGVVWMDIGLAMARPNSFYSFQMGLDLEPV